VLERRIAALFAILLASVAISPAKALADDSATLYVHNSANSGCSDTGPGTQAQPICTIRAAADVVNPGQTVMIAKGTYPGGLKFPGPVRLPRILTSRVSGPSPSARRFANGLVPDAPRPAVIT
jgi:hypothetical protein